MVRIRQFVGRDQGGDIHVVLLRDGAQRLTRSDDMQDSVGAWNLQLVAWLEDGGALHDRLEPGYSLLRLGRTHARTSALESAFRRRGAPLTVLDLTDERPRELYGYDLVLVRPDLHVAWRGNAAPADPEAVVDRATGWQD